MNKQFDYSKFFSSPELLANAVLSQYKIEVGDSRFPINPFKILQEFDIKLLLRKFKKIEGLYIPSKDDNDIDLVAINYERPLYRQRFTAAHEICHFIKDRNSNIICPINGRKNSIEEFADKFAGCLLMPQGELLKQVTKYANSKGKVELEDVIYISEYFGVSFESCAKTIAYRIGKLSGDINKIELDKRIKKIKPERLREEFGISNILKLTREMADVYCYARPYEPHATCIRFKEYLYLNENRLENVDISEQEINYMLADLRLNGDYSKYEGNRNHNILEALGNIEMLEFVLNTDISISVWQMQRLQGILFKYTPHGVELPFPRQSNKNIIGAEISTVDCSMVSLELIKVEEQIKELLKIKEQLTISQYILESIKIHHRLTVIHPLEDGNGRVSRAMLLWLLKLKKIPPFYIQLDEKEDYLYSLNKLDREGNSDFLELFVLKQLMKSIVMLDEKLEL